MREVLWGAHSRAEKWGVSRPSILGHMQVMNDNIHTGLSAEWPLHEWSQLFHTPI